MGMGLRGNGWREYLKSSDEKPEWDRELIGRVMSYALPHRDQIVEMFVLIVGTTGLGLCTLPVCVSNLGRVSDNFGVPLQARPSG